MKRKNNIYIKLLKKANHTVFGVGENGQKLYYDPVHRKKVPYSSGQQVKRCIIDSLVDNLEVDRAEAIMNFSFEGKKIEQKEITELCDPSYPDQLIAGWMLAASKKEKRNDDDGEILKRRSPLSISAMTPLHPNLASYYSETVTHDRSQEYNDEMVLRKGDKEEWRNDEIENFLQEKNKSISKNKWIGYETRANGLFTVDMAIELEKLFTVPIKLFDKEVSKKTEDKLRNDGWESVMIKNIEHLQLPPEKIYEYSDAIAQSLINWLIKSNQSRTYSPMPVISIAISDASFKPSYAIKADKVRVDGNISARLTIDENVRGVNLYTTPIANEYFFGGEITTNPNAIEDAKEYIEKEIINYYQNSK